MKRAQLISQGSLNRMLQAAEESWYRRKFDENIELLERASRMAPAHTGILLQLGRMYGLRYNYTAAEEAFEKGIRVAPVERKTEALSVAARHSNEFRNSNMSERFFLRAVEQKDVRPEILVLLAERYERLRRLDDARALISRALRVNPACGPALLARARLERQEGRLEDAEKLLRAIPENTDKESRARSFYELGTVLDQSGRYDEAMSAFLEAKAVLLPDVGQLHAHRQIVRMHLKALIASVTPKQLRRWFDAGQELQPRRRVALLCGHPRSGTTLLEQVLDSHPDIISAEETEIFHDDAYAPLTRDIPRDKFLLTGPVQMTVPLEVAPLEQAKPEALLQSRANYYRSMELCLGSPIGERLLIDKNPSLTFLILAFNRIFPENKMLVALRDPRDVCLSCFMQPFFPLNQINTAYLSLEGTAQEYASLVEMWLAIKAITPNPYLEVRYEDMVEDLESVSRRTMDFLGVAWDARVLRFNEHAQKKMVRSPTYADVTKPVFKRAVGRWRNYQKYLEPHLGKLEPFVKAFGYE